MKPNKKLALGPSHPLEVHKHTFVSGRRAHGHNLEGAWETGTFSHSHAGGNTPHQHPETGPAAYTIDKDAWLRATGMRGGGRKKFTAKPSGEQFPIVELEEWQKTFKVILCEPTPLEWGTGPGVSLPQRIALTFKQNFEVEIERKNRK